MKESTMRKQIKSKRLDIRCTQEERNALKRAAKRYDMTVTDYILSCVQHDTGKGKVVA